MSRAPVIVSLTTIPTRAGLIGPTITSLFRQSVTPDEVCVYATSGCERLHDQFGSEWSLEMDMTAQAPLWKIVVTGESLVPDGATLRWFDDVSDLGPLTKLSAVADPGLSDDTIVITCDDDAIYDPRWLETLVNAVERDPDCAVGLSGWNASAPLGKLTAPPVSCDVLEGCAGVAYRKSFFDHTSALPSGSAARSGSPDLAGDVWDIPESCRWVDDVWISGYLAKRGIGRRLVGHKLHRSAPHDDAGLHTRDDFVALNRAAARMMFGC
jgi:hypothetical protein